MISFNRYYLVPAALAAMLAGCGGGDGGAGGFNSSTPSTLEGTAAVGSPIVGGSIKVTCAGGGPLTTTTSGTGTWQVTTSGQTLPCAVQVSGGTVGGVANTTPYHSVAVAFGTLNVTPLTDLVVAQVTGSAPQTWFASPAFAPITSGAIATALTTLNTALGITSTLGTLDPLTSSFTAATGNQMDNTLQALKAALAAQSQTYAALLSASQTRNFEAFTGFSTKLATAYSSVGTSGTGVGGTVLGNMVVTGIGSSARNGTYTPTTVAQASGADTDVNGQTTDGKFELDVVYAANGTIKSAAVWFFGSGGAITFFGCNNGTVPCGNLVGYEPLMKQILFNRAVLSQVTDPFASGGMTLVSGGEKIQVDGQISAK